MTNFRLTALAHSLPATVPFVGPEAQERANGRRFKARLGANENVFGPSPLAIKAMAECDQWMYGDPESHDLRCALADHHDTTPDQIIVGEGIDGLLNYLVRLFVGPGDAVVTSDGAYPTFNYHVAGFGGVLHKVPYRDDHEDPAALFAKAAEVDAKLVYLSNPDNPMGSWHAGSQISQAMDRLPDGTLLCLDEAYIECAPDGPALPVDFSDPRDPDADVLQSVRPGGCAGRLCPCGTRSDHRLSQGAQPFWYEPCRSGGRAGRTSGQRVADPCAT